MVLDTNRVVTELPYREIMQVSDAAGTRVDCLRGRVWITEARCPGDVVLKAGESYEISGGDVTVVQALRDARVQLRAPAMCPAGAGLAASIESLWSRCGARATRRQPSIA